MDNFLEEVIIGGQTIRLRFDEVPLEQLELDEDNPRIRYKLKLQQNGKSLEDVIRATPDFAKLSRDIEKSGGLRERVILRENGGGKLKTVEGNCRVVVLQGLNSKHPTDPRWKKVPARILPKDVDPKSIAILLSDYHVAGKVTWGPHEKAGHVYQMVHVLGMSQDDVAVYLHTSKSTVNRLLAAYSMMVDRFLAIDEGKYAKEGERKWSYFEEFHKSKDLREELKNNSEFADDFSRWVGDGRIPKGEDVRNLSKILTHSDARKKFEKGALSFADAYKTAIAAQPEADSDFFRLLQKVRESCSNAAQIKDVLRIREDKVARQRMIDTYNALVGFMKLADVEPPKE